MPFELPAEQKDNLCRLTGDFFETIATAEGDCSRLKALISEVEGYANFVPVSAAAELQRYSANLQRIKVFGSGACAALVHDARPTTVGDWMGERIYQALCDDVGREQEGIRQLLNSLKSKVYFLRALRTLDVIHVDSSAALAEAKRTHSRVDHSLHLLFFNYLNAEGEEPSEAHRAVAARGSFLRKSRKSLHDLEKKIIPVAVDLDMESSIAIDEGLPMGTHTCFYSNGEYTLDDTLDEGAARLAFRRTFLQDPVLKSKPEQCVMLTSKCVDDQCDDTSWFCAICGEPLEYGFDNAFYCECGALPVSEYKLECGNAAHNSKREPLTLQHLKPLDEVNILLLAEPRAGKSSWLNSIPNYLLNKTFDDAVKSRLVFLTPTAFWTEDDEHRVVEVKSPMARRDEPKRPRVHKLKTPNCLYRFVDVPVHPSAGDNAEGIRHLRELLEENEIFNIHSLCLLLRSNEQEINFMLIFLARELYRMFEPTFSKNISFCLTHSRETFFRPGDVMRLLQTMSEASDLKIPLSQASIFCMDSEHLRYLSAVQQGLKLPHMTNDLQHSWPQAVETVKSFLSYVSQLKPHALVTKENDDSTTSPSQMTSHSLTETSPFFS